MSSEQQHVGPGSSVSVIGMGAMGRAVAKRLLLRGFRVSVWNRTPARARTAGNDGAMIADSPADAARGAAAVITMVADPTALDAITDGSDGIAAGALPPTIVIEMSTVGPDAIKKLANRLRSGVGLLDAPVLGSVEQATNGELEVFVGGDPTLFDRCRPLFDVLGRPHHVGMTGCGAAAKLVANSTLFGALVALGEALALADAFGLERKTAFEVLETTPLAAQARRRRPHIESCDYPARFALRLARKDAALISEAAAGLGVDVRAAHAVLAWYTSAQDAGYGDLDYSAVLEAIAGRQRDTAEK